MAVEAINDESRAPGAWFHRVNSLVPDDQDLLVVPAETPVPMALELMLLHEFSQLPVVAGVEVLGLFTHKSLSARLATIGGRVSLADHDVEDFMIEPAFFRVTDELHSLFPALDCDGAALVGDPDNLLAVVTPTDVTDYLHLVTRPFVLIQEIEVALRSLIQNACDGDAVSGAIAEAVGHEFVGRENSAPETLDELTLYQLVMVVLNRKSYESVFVAVLGRNRAAARDKLLPISDIRNTILHFRRTGTADEIQQLEATRAWLLRKSRMLSAAS